MTNDVIDEGLVGDVPVRVALLVMSSWGNKVVSMVREQFWYFYLYRAKSHDSHMIYFIPV